MKFTLFLVALIVTIFSVASAITYAAQRYECSNVKRISTQVTVRWHGWAGCYVTENGKTFPLDKWRNDE